MGEIYDRYLGTSQFLLYPVWYRRKLSVFRCTGTDNVDVLNGGRPGHYSAG
jgi:hypothetical protein